MLLTVDVATPQDGARASRPRPSRARCPRSHPDLPATGVQVRELQSAPVPVGKPAVRARPLCMSQRPRTELGRLARGPCGAGKMPALPSGPPGNRGTGSRTPVGSRAGWKTGGTRTATLYVATPQDGARASRPRPSRRGQDARAPSPSTRTHKLDSSGRRGPRSHSRPMRRDTAPVFGQPIAPQLACNDRRPNAYTPIESMRTLLETGSARRGGSQTFGLPADFPRAPRAARSSSEEERVVLSQSAATRSSPTPCEAEYPNSLDLAVTQSINRFQYTTLPQAHRT